MDASTRRTFAAVAVAMVRRIPQGETVLHGASIVLTAGHARHGLGSSPRRAEPPGSHERVWGSFLLTFFDGQRRGGSPVGVLGAGGPPEGSLVGSQLCEWPEMEQGAWPGVWLTLAPLSASRRGQKCQHTRVSYVCRGLFNLVLGCGEVSSVGSQ